MNYVETVQKIRDHINAGRRDANTADIIQQARDALRSLDNQKQATELARLIGEMEYLPSDHPKSWPGSTDTKIL